MGGWESSLRDDCCNPTEAGRRIIRGFPITFISQISLPTHAQISREVGGFFHSTSRKPYFYIVRIFNTPTDC